MHLCSDKLCVAAVVHVGVLQVKKNWKKGEVRFLSHNATFSTNPHPPSLYFVIFTLVAHGNTLTMRSSGHPIIFNWQTNKQQQARCFGIDSKALIYQWLITEEKNLTENDLEISSQTFSPTLNEVIVYMETMLTWKENSPKMTGQQK